MDLRRLAVVQGMDVTRAALRRWNAAPWPVLWPWLLLSLAIAFGLLYGVWVVASASTPDATLLALPGPSPANVVGILARNSLVLALHAMACVAGFIAGSTLPAEAQRMTGTWRRVHDLAGPLAIGFVTAATLFSLGTQVLALGRRASTLAAQLGFSPAELLLLHLPHALPELTALFLPLAAWLVASRRGRWDELLAATAATVALAAPVLVLAAVVEVYVTPRLVLHFV